MDQFERILDRIVEETGGNLIRDEDVTFEGSKIILPEGTTIGDNWRFLHQYEKDQEEVTSFQRQYTFKLYDVANATIKALRGAFGAVRHTGDWLTPPALVDVPCGPGETVQVPIGHFTVPALPDVSFEVTARRDEKYGTVGFIMATGPKKHSHRVEAIFNLIANELDVNSLYRGKAFTDDEKPEFIDTARIDPSKIVYSELVQKQLAGSVFSRLDYPEAMAKVGVRFRSCTLLSGEFGVGKTEALNLIAKRAVEKGITFIKVATGGDLMQAMQTARMYSPAVLAFEDVDSLGSAENESDHIQQVLEAFDGQQAKLSDVMLIVTTNYEHSLHKGLVRPGRIDGIIRIGPPDAAGIQRLIEVRSPDGLLAPDVDWEAVTTAYEGFFPSFVVEAASKAIRYAIVRLDGVLNGHSLTTEDLVDAAQELRPQFELHREASTGVQRPDLTVALEDTVRRALGMGEVGEEIIGGLAQVVAGTAGDVMQHTQEGIRALGELVKEEESDTRYKVEAEADSIRETIVDNS
jgi:transitional endoplasmic reticulum ATPase